MTSSIANLSDAEFKKELASLIPHLRAFARNLTRNAAASDDLAQEAMLKAWKARDRFEAGSNLKAWVFTILRNQFYSDKRRDWRSQPLDSEVAEQTIPSADNPEDNMELLTLRNAMQCLPDDQREAIILVGAGGLSYEEAAEICNCATGTIKSRVSRGRIALIEIIESNSASYTDDDKLNGSKAFEEIVNQADELINAAQPTSTN
ncbi:sigma-70 family RNA polymerase sigma factor [Hirschia baltica]|uniref:RNA polymerase, sigma-24 subunit, ECF subfamily n=1 Tax=Hirschia baltica (strain ATCC 49814 / DSM 5838 / IFAM 1418) TaxID=582402 RepID=C6XLB8_HIRBI|nr:sigma-70 family RNA polymerase sigma factor [Hirschia baltica]ACT59717.1 RNA polymerase, sigma-24 subunit, ECF subfamily [Hirschia baltica ATCC 49814]